MSNPCNNCAFIGNLGADPELIGNSGGSAVAKLRLAVNGRRKIGDQWQDHTTWIYAVAFGRTAEIIEQYCRKGSKVAIQCRYQTSQWEDKDGNKRSSPEFVVESVHLLGSGEQRNASAPSQRRNAGAEDGIPF